MTEKSTLWLQDKMNIKISHKTLALKSPGIVFYIRAFWRTAIGIKVFGKGISDGIKIILIWQYTA